MKHIILIFDPYCICEEKGLCVENVHTEKQAFEEIDRLLKESDSDSTDAETFIIKGLSCQHFQTYRTRLAGVSIQDVTPRSVLLSRFSSCPSLPEWLSEELIYKSSLLKRMDMGDNQECTSWIDKITDVFMPGNDGVSSLGEWFSMAGSAQEFPSVMVGTPVHAFIIDGFRNLCCQFVKSPEMTERIVAQLAEAGSPVSFAREWMKLLAILPLVRPEGSNCIPLLRQHILQKSYSPFCYVIARQLPLVFPLPPPMQQEVSGLFASVIKNARLQDGCSFESAVLSLNAWWDGIVTELQTWLAISPRGMTQKAVDHLMMLPGYEGNREARSLIEYYRPPLPVPAWTGLDNDFDAWVQRYAGFIRSAFARRDLPDLADDPACKFGRWIKDNHRVSFDHPDRGYVAFAKRTKELLSCDRRIVVVMIDALAIQLASDAISYINDNVGATPTAETYLFAPLPTLTTVCKQAILTGFRPDQCSGELIDLLCQAYGLSREQVILAANWRDAERIQIKDNTRLVVYRDNRLDEKLSSVASFRELLEDSASIFSRLAIVLGRWVRDMQFLSKTPPAVLLCADHGFTYNPAPDVQSMATVSGVRCIISDDSSARKNDDSATYIDKNDFHNKHGYMAALGRLRGSSTVSGWSFSHGGLLPEEVIIPMVEWYGDQKVLPWPVITFSKKALYADGRWFLTMAVYNPTSIMLRDCLLEILPVGHGHTPSTGLKLPAINPKAKHICTIEVPDSSPSNSDSVSFEITMKMKKDSGDIVPMTKSYVVQRERSFVDKTQGQIDFENMF